MGVLGVGQEEVREEVISESKGLRARWKETASGPCTRRDMERDRPWETWGASPCVALRA